MSEMSRNFIKASLIYLAAGVTLGLLMAIGNGTVWQGSLIAAHAHINLLGWVSMLMFGVAYHIIPRFHGRMLHSDKLGNLHFWLANIGLVGLALFMFLRAVEGTAQFATPGMAVFGSVWAISAYMFVYNLWKTMGGAVAQAPSPPMGR